MAKRSVYAKVRAGKANRMMRRMKIASAVGESMMLSGGGVALTLGLVPALAVIGIGSLVKAGAEGALPKLKRNAMRTATISRLIGSAKTAKGAAASISRARQVLDRTAAARSMAASRKVVPRPAGQRVRNNESKGGDGQTEGYYRNQGGKRVFVQGYATPPGRSR